MRLVVAMGLVAAMAAPAFAGVVLLGTTQAGAERDAIEAAREVAPSFTFADVDAPDAGEALRHADVILAVGSRALTMARAVAPATPTVYAMVPAAEAHADKSVTGVALEVPAYAQLAQWKQLRFEGQRVALVYDKAAPAIAADASKAAKALGLTLTARAVDGVARAAAAVDELAPKSDAVWIASVWPAGTAAKWSSKVALLGSDDKSTSGGALFSLAPDARDIGRRAARIAVGIAGRAADARVPVPAPTTSPGALFLNASSAAALGIELPDPIVHKARKVVH